MLSNEIIELLQSKEGNKLLRELTPEMTKHQRSDLKKRMINPPDYVVQWILWQKKIEAAYLESKINKK